MPIPADEILMDDSYANMIIVPTWNIPKIVQAPHRIRRSADHEEIVRRYMEMSIISFAHEDLIHKLLKNASKKPVTSFVREMEQLRNKRMMRKKNIQTRNLKR